MVASEVAPYAKTGGLADVVGALPRALAQRGHIVDVIMPRYRGVAMGHAVGRLHVPLGARSTDVTMFEHRAGRVRTIFVDHAESFDRDALYGAGAGDYPDNPARFAVLSRAATEWAAQSVDGYDVIHAHDWQTGLVPVFARQAETRGLRPVPVVFTIHNLAYQGLTDAEWLPRLGLGWDLMRVDALEFWGRVSFLKAGVVFSNRISTVSPTYAAEIQTPEYGCGFEGLLQRRSADLVGIVNGIDYDQWNPSADPYLPQPFDAVRLDGKVAAKQLVLQQAGWRTDGESLRRPLIGMISRMVDQKGLDLLVALGDELLGLGARFVVLGTGEPRYEEFWRSLAARAPDCVSATIGFDEGMAHRIEGGADMFLMPSRFEPCGLNQLYSQRYGTVPIVRATGGLRDTVCDVGAAASTGTGFVFTDYAPAALAGTLRRALQVFEDRAAWRRIQVAGMQQDFSWDQSARQYVSLYERAGLGGAAHARTAAPDDLGDQ